MLDLFKDDLANIVNDLNLELQGKDKTMVNTISSVNAFKQKMQHQAFKLQGHVLGNFHNLTSELEMQWKACALLEPVATFICYPFWEDTEVVSHQTLQHCFT